MESRAKNREDGASAFLRSRRAKLEFCAGRRTNMDKFKNSVLVVVAVVVLVLLVGAVVVCSAGQSRKSGVFYWSTAEKRACFFKRR